MTSHVVLSISRNCKKLTFYDTMIERGSRARNGQCQRGRKMEIDQIRTEKKLERNRNA